MLKIITCNFIICLALVFTFANYGFASNGKQPEAHAHEEHGEEGNEEEGHSNKKSGDGFTVSKNGMITFGLKFVKMTGLSVILPSSSLLKSLDEVNIYRFRNGAFKRIDFKTLKQNGSAMTISSPDLMLNDEVVTSGVSFLRIAELATAGGLEHSH